jgi:hypothetical protein
VISPGELDCESKRHRMAQLVRLYTRNPGTTVADESFASGDAVEVVLDAEARTGELAAGIAFSVVVLVVNLSTLAIEAVTAVGDTPASGVTANMASPAWPFGNEHRELVYLIDGAVGAANDMFLVLAALRVGAVAPFDAYFKTTYWMRTP